MEERMKRSKAGDAGFSLVELLVAMVVTAIVSGAIYGMMLTTQKSFQREPEVADRQQNIRIAMDLIMRDLAEAGVGIALPGTTNWVQIFSITNQDESGGPLANCAGAPSDTRPGQGACVASVINATQKADDLEMLTNPRGDCGAEEVCGYGAQASQAFLTNNGTCATPGDMVLFLMDDGTWTLRAVQRSFDNSGKGSGDAKCEVNDHAAVGFPSSYGPPGVNPPQGLCSGKGIGTAGTGYNGNNCVPKYISRAQVVTYHVRDCRDGSDMSCLWRRATGNLGYDTGQVDNKGNPIYAYDDFFGGYKMIARGIEDMQVEYAAAAAPDTWLPAPPAVDAQNKNYGTLTVKVRVTLSARAATRMLTGARWNAAGGNALRGQLTSVAAVRATLAQLTNETPRPKWQ
jgi:prepilin-type N-terminal cleavage/methylation domain-containing protein